MVRYKNSNVLFGLLILAKILFLELAYAQEKPEPKLLWKKDFNEKIKDFYISYDGSVILVNTETEKRTTKGNFILKNYLLNKDGNVKKIFEEKRPSSGWVLSSDGNEIIDNYGRIFDKGNKTKRMTNLKLLISKISYPVFSPSKKFVAIQGATEAEGTLSIEMYDLFTGILLWEYKPSPLQETFGSFKIRFVNDERLVVYEGRTVRLLNVQTGEKIWEVELFRDSDVINAFSLDLDIVVNNSGDLAIVKFSSGYVASVSRYGKFRWGRILGDRYAANMALSPSGKFLSIITIPAWQLGIKYPPGYICLIDNLNGEIVWKKELGIGFGNAGMYGEGHAAFVSDQYLLYSSQALKEDEDKGKFILLIDCFSGQTIWKWKPESANTGPICLSGNKNRLLVMGGENNLYLFDISGLLGGGK